MNDDSTGDDVEEDRPGVESVDGSPDAPDDESQEGGFPGDDVHAAVDAGDPSAENVAFVALGALLTLFALGRVAGVV